MDRGSSHPSVDILVLVPFLIYGTRMRMSTDEWLEPRTIDRVLDLDEVFVEELKLVLDLEEVFVEELKLVLDLVEGFLEELKLVLVLVE
jgi:hypothetical protein